MKFTSEQIAAMQLEEKQRFEQDRLVAIKSKSYDILQLAGRCANGSELDSGVLWHAVMNRYRAVCGQTYGRRSAGWSSWEPENRQVTCPRCIKTIARLSK